MSLTDNPVAHSFTMHTIANSLMEADVVAEENTRFELMTTGSILKCLAV